MKKSIQQKRSEAKRINIKTLRILCSQIYKKLYSIKSISYTPKLTTGNKTVLNCECKKHKICFSTTKDLFLSIGKRKNTTSCIFCREEKHRNKFNSTHYQKMVDRYKGKNIALVKEARLGKLLMECLKHGTKYSQFTHSLTRCGCNLCSADNPRTNSKITLEQIKHDIIKWGDSLSAVKIVTNHNKNLGSVKEILYRCTKLGHEGDIIKPLNARLYNNPCEKCALEAKSLTYNQMMERGLKLHPIGYTYTQTKDVYTTTDKIQFKCPTCSSDNLMPFRSHFYENRGCRKCKLKLRGENERITDAKLTSDLKEMGINNLYLTGLKIYDTNQKKKKLLRQLVCTIHNTSFYAVINKFTLKKIGCKECNLKSKMERFIEGYIKKKGIIFETQKKFKDCINVNQLPFDFYIPNVPLTNKSLLIEYDGGHHYFPIHGEELLKQQVKRDAIKTDYAKSVGIDLIRIPYTKDKQIIQILDKILFGNKPIS